MKPTTTCPYCREKTASRDPGLWPFCSKGCQNKDLSGWVFENYRIEGAAVSAEDVSSAYETSEEEESSLR